MALFNEGGFLCFCYNKAFAKETQEEEGRAKESILVLIILVCIPIASPLEEEEEEEEEGRVEGMLIAFLLYSYCVLMYSRWRRRVE